MRGKLPAALADLDQSGSSRMVEDAATDQRIVEHDLRAFQQAQRTQCQQIFGTGTGADQINRSRGFGQRIIPAPTVLFVVSSMTMKAPVARLTA